MQLSLSRVPVDRVVAGAKAVRWGRLLLSLILGLFYALGWLAGRVLLGIAVLWVAVKLGWSDVRKADNGPA